LQGDAIQGFSDGMTEWYIEPAGEGLHRVRENISTLLKETTLTKSTLGPLSEQRFSLDGTVRRENSTFTTTTIATTSPPLTKQKSIKLTLQPAQGQDTQIFHFDGPF